MNNISKPNKILNIKIIIIIIIITGISVAEAYSQRKLKYKNVYEIIEQGNKEMSFSILNEFIKEDTLNSNAYWQLALICDYWAQNADPLTQTIDIKYYIERAKKYYNLADSVANDKDIRKNKEYYTLIESDKRRIELEDVKKDIGERLVKLSDFEALFLNLTKNYNNSVGNYNRCFEIFINLNRKYTILNDLLLDGNEQLYAKLDSLSNHFDSCLIYLKKYQFLLEKYPQKKYKQQYSLKEINIYRLDGLTPVNFLENKLKLWNYKKWASNVKVKLHETMKLIISNIDKTEEYLNIHINQLTDSSAYKSTHEKISLNEDLYFQIAQYDPDPLVFKTFRYKKAKYNYLASFYHPYNNSTKNNKIIPLNNRLKHILTIKSKKDIATSKLNLFCAAVSSKSKLKYNGFYKKYYNGFEGVTDFCRNEYNFIETYWNNTLNNLKINILMDLFNTDSLFANYKDNKISLIGNQFPDSLHSKEKQYYTISKHINNKNEIFLAGYYCPANNRRSAFVAKTDKNQKIKWLKNYKTISRINSYAYLINSDDLGCNTIIHSLDQDSIILANFIRYNNIGKSITNQKLDTNKIIQDFYYDDINEKLLIAYKGKESNYFKNISDNLLLKYIQLNDSLIWQKNLSIKGNIQDIIKINKYFYIFCNVYEYVDNQVIKKSKATNGSNILIIKINEESGDIKYIPILTKESQIVTHVVKLNQKTINIIGFQADINDITNQAVKNKPLVYYLINENGEIFYQNQ